MSTIPLFMSADRADNVGINGTAGKRPRYTDERLREASSPRPISRRHGRARLRRAVTADIISSGKVTRFSQPISSALASHPDKRLKFRLRLNVLRCASDSSAEDYAMANRDRREHLMASGGLSHPEVESFGAPLLDPTRTATVRGRSRAFVEVLQPQHSITRQVLRGAPVDIAATVKDITLVPRPKHLRSTSGWPIASGKSIETMRRTVEAMVTLNAEILA